MGWRSMFIIGWGGVILGLGAVVKSSRTMGLSTWWLGPEADPNNVVFNALPFVVPVIVVILAFRNVRYLPYFGLLGAIALAAIATGDIGRFDALAQVELLTAAVGLLVSIAAFAGMLRPATADPHELAAGIAAHPAQPVPVPVPAAEPPSVEPVAGQMLPPPSPAPID